MNWIDCTKSLDQIFDLHPDDPLVMASPLLLGGCILAAVLYVGLRELIRSMYLIPLAGWAAALALAFRLLGLPLLYAIGAQLCGLVVLAWISNYYFYH